MAPVLRIPFLIVALILFVLAALPVDTRGYSLSNAGLAFLTAAFLAG